MKIFELAVYCVLSLAAGLLIPSGTEFWRRLSIQVLFGFAGAAMWAAVS